MSGKVGTAYDIILVVCNEKLVIFPCYKHKAYVLAVITKLADR